MFCAEPHVSINPVPAPSVQNEEGPAMEPAVVGVPSKNDVVAIGGSANVGASSLVQRPKEAAEKIDVKPQPHQQQQIGSASGDGAATTTPSQPTAESQVQSKTVTVATERQIKKTCEACVKSKVKCDGHSPCDRCMKRGVDCIFLMEQKRGRRPGPLHDKDGLLKVKKVKPEHDQDASPSKAPFVTKTALRPEGKKPNVTVERKEPVATTLPVVRMPLPNVNDPASAGLAYPGLLQASQFAPFTPLFNSGFSNPLTIAHLPQPTMMQMSPVQGSMMWPTIPSGMFPPSAPFANFIPGGYESAIAAALNSQVSWPTTLPNTFERRMIRTLFALVKYHHLGAHPDAERTKWFEARFSKLCSGFRSQGATAEEQTLRNWLGRHGFRVDLHVEPAPISPLMVKHGPNFARLSKHSHQQHFHSGVKLGTMNVFSNFQVECDDDLRRALGLDPRSLGMSNTWLPPGFLPWGADVIASLAKKDEDVLAHVLDMAAVFASAQPDQSGVFRAKKERPVTIVHANGLEINCVVLSDVIESVTTGGVLLQGVSLHFYFNDGSLAPPKGEILSLGPWPNARTTNTMQSWLEPIVHWVDSDEPKDQA